MFFSLIETNALSTSDTRAKRLIEERESTDLFLGLLLDRLGGRLSSGGGSSGGRSRGGNSEGGGVLDHLLQLVDLLPRELGLDSDGDEVLVSVEDNVGEGGNGGHVDRQGQRGNTSETSGEVGQDVIVSDVQNGGRIDGTLIINGLNDESIEEGLDVQHLQEGGLRRTDLLANLDQLDVRDNLNLTLVNLGRNVQGLQERGLGGLHTGVTSGDGNVNGGNGSSLGRGSNLEGKELGANRAEVSLGENQTDVALEQGKQVSDVGIVSLVGTEGTTDHGLRKAERRE